MSTAVVLFAHGARDPEWAMPFRRIEQRLRGARPHAVIRLAFLEFMLPGLPQTIDDVIAAGAQRVMVVPLFMAPGGHLKHDVPRLIVAAQKQHPGVDILLKPTIGEVDDITDAIANWVESLIIAE